MKKILLIFVGTLFVTGIGVGAYLLGKSSSKTQNNEITITPTPTQEPSPTQSISPTAGFISGSLSFPSEELPDDLEVCAQNTLTEVVYCTAERLSDPAYTYGIGYKIEVPVGSYRVYAKTQSGNYKAYFSEFVTCGLAATCKSHDPITVTVSSGQTVQNIDPGDWYAPIPTTTTTPTP